MSNLNPLGGAGMQPEGPKDPTSINKPTVQTVSSESADFRPGRSEQPLPASPVKVMGKQG